MPGPLRAERRAHATVGAVDDGVLRHVEARMMVAFCPPLDPAEVQHHVVSAAAEFESARIRTYLAVLIERAAVERLRRAVRRRETNGARTVRVEGRRRPIHLRLIAHGPARTPVEKEAS